jgi:hypothetical protein
MLWKLPTLRSAMITTTALITGAFVDALAQSTASYLGSHQQGLGEFIIAITASWVLDRLNCMVNATNELITMWSRPLERREVRGAVTRARWFG